MNNEFEQYSGELRELRELREKYWQDQWTLMLEHFGEEDSA